MLVGIYLNHKRSSTNSKSAESGNYEAFVMVFYCHFINKVMFCKSRDKTYLSKLWGRGYKTSKTLYVLGK